MDIIKKLKTGATKAADVAQQTVEFTKLTAQVTARKRDIEKQMALIGREVYEAYESGDVSLSEGKVKELCASVHELKQEIAALERQLRYLRNERTCACGKVLPTDAKFCPDCGRPQDFTEKEIITIDASPVPERDEDPER